MTLKDLGWNSSWQNDFANIAHTGVEPARVTEELRERYRVRSASEETLAKIAGKLRFGASDRADFPAVGDWVAIERSPGAREAIIHHVLPRRTQIARKVAGRVLEQQIIAANVDTVFVVVALNHEFNLRRIERYVALVWDSGAQPVILLNKADLCEYVAGVIAEVEFSAPGVPVYALSAATNRGLDALNCHLQPGRTAAFIGSSGVGKSTIINRLLGDEVQPTLPVRSGDDRGCHTTTSRQLFALTTGGLVIDTPGMRELQLWDAEDGLGAAFDEIESLARDCRYRDCAHQLEPGCAVRHAVDSGMLSAERLANFHKLRAEQSFLDRKLDIHAAQEAKARARASCKAVREVKKIKDRT